MDELGNFIQDNRDAFDDYELPAGHAGRFERKLMRRGKRRPIYLVASLLTAACVALFIFLVQGKMEEQEHLIIAENCNEHTELMFYYQMKVNGLKNEMERFSKYSELSGIKQLMIESEKLLAENEKFEQETVPTLPCSDIGTRIISMHYSQNIKDLTFMMRQMDEMVKRNN